MYFFPLLCYIEQTKRVGGGFWRGRAAFYLLIEEAVSPSLPTPAPTRHPSVFHFISVFLAFQLPPFSSPSMAARVTRWGSDLVAPLLGTCLSFSCGTAQ